MSLSKKNRTEILLKIFAPLVFKKTLKELSRQFNSLSRDFKLLDKFEELNNDPIGKHFYKITIHNKKNKFDYYKKLIEAQNELMDKIINKEVVKEYNEEMNFEKTSNRYKTHMDISKTIYLLKYFGEEIKKEIDGNREIIEKMISENEHEKYFKSDGGEMTSDDITFDDFDDEISMSSSIYSNFMFKNTGNRMEKKKRFSIFNFEKKSKNQKIDETVFKNDENNEKIKNKNEDIKKKEEGIKNEIPKEIKEDEEILFINYVSDEIKFIQSLFINFSYNFNEVELLNLFLNSFDDYLFHLCSDNIEFQNRFDQFFEN
jgi:hypothetical protein